MAALGPIDYFNVQDKMLVVKLTEAGWQRQSAAIRLGSTNSSRSGHPDTWTEHQRTNAALSREIQRAELQEKALDSR